MSAVRATHHLHSSLSTALSHDISRHLKSLLTVSIQFFSGLPLLFFLSGTQCSTWLTLLSLSMRHTWPSHFNLLHALLSRSLSLFSVVYMISLWLSSGPFI